MTPWIRKFNRRYGHRGGWSKFQRMQAEGYTYREISDHFKVDPSAVVRWNAKGKIDALSGGER